MKIPEDKIVSLRRNEVFGSVGPHRMPITCDTGADVTVVPDKCVEPHQRTGEFCELKAFNDSKSTGEWCMVDITVDDITFQKKAVTQLGESLGWLVCLSLDMADPTEGQFLLEKMQQRAAMSWEEILYMPPEVRDGFLVSGILAAEAEAVQVKRNVVVANVEKNTQTESGRQVPVQSAATEAQEKVAEKVEVEDKAEEVGDVLVAEDDNLVVDEAEGAPSEGSAVPEGEKDLDISSIRQVMSRSDLAEATKSDHSLEPLFKLGEADREGYHTSQGLLFRTQRDNFESTIEQLCIPSSHRQKCLVATHSNFGHQGRNKMLMLLRPHFYWPNMSRDCRDFVRSCDRCQVTDKSVPKPQTMVERTVVTQPFQNVAIDLVGPFPTAVGGYKHMLTCIDSASRWPEAIPVRSTTTKVVIKCLTEIFSRCGFPVRLTSDNGSQFVSKEFKKWLQDKEIAHSRATPYHPQGNGVVERLHRTLVAKTVEAKGNWAKVLPMALYFLWCTPSASTGVSPFLVTHGWEPRTNLQVLYQSWVESVLGGVDLADWILENQERVECVRDIATSNLVQASAKRTETWNKRAVSRSFNVGDSVWVRRPGLDLKLRESWVGPGKVVACNSPVSYKIQLEDRLIPTVHIQQLKIVQPCKAVKRVTSVLEQDSSADDITDRFAEAQIEEQTLTDSQQSELAGVLGRFKMVLDKEPGLTTLVNFEMDTGDEKPIYQRPYSTPVAFREKVDVEIDWLLQRGFIRPSSSPWASPMVTVKKADGSARLCVDFHKITV